MTKQGLTIKVLDIDEGDDVIQYQIWLKNTDTSTSIKFYNYSDFFKNFANNLMSFPKGVNEEVLLEIDESSFFKIYCYQPTGHTAIHIKIDNNSNHPYTNKCEFFIKTIPASINILGETLKNWNPETQNEFIWITE